MARKDLHDKPFDEGTIAKLELFEDYAQAWIPTFVMQNCLRFCIIDFFAGTGYDINHVPGSPIRLLQKIKDHVEHITERKIKINLYLNEYDKNKFELLKSACIEYLTINSDINSDINNAISLTFFNEDFDKLFPQLLPIINQMPSLVYLDQNGIRFLSEKYFLELEKTRQTDILYFVSSSYFWRFGETDGFKVHLDIDMDEAKKNPYKFIHRSIINQIRAKLPTNSSLKLYPFSIKKGPNIHGIIFGASHPRAVDKFLSLSWKRNKTNGEANFDIDDDLNKSQLDLFEGIKLTKIESFQKRLREKILNGEIVDNFDAYDFVLEEGHIGSHAADEIKKMKKEKFINYESTSPLVTYDNVYKNKNKIKYTIMGFK